MFFHETFVTNPIFKKTWLAAHEIKNTRHVPINKVCKAIKKNHHRLSLRSTAFLVNGAVNIYDNQLNEIIEDLANLDAEMERSISSIDETNAIYSSASSNGLSPEVRQSERASNLQGSPVNNSHRTPISQIESVKEYSLSTRIDEMENTVPDFLRTDFSDENDQNEDHDQNDEDDQNNDADQNDNNCPYEEKESSKADEDTEENYECSPASPEVMRQSKRASDIQESPVQKSRRTSIFEVETDREYSLLTRIDDSEKSGADFSRTAEIDDGDDQNSDDSSNDEYESSQSDEEIYQYTYPKDIRQHYQTSLTTISEETENLEASNDNATQNSQNLSLLNSNNKSSSKSNTNKLCDQSRSKRKRTNDVEETGTSSDTTKSKEQSSIEKRESLKTNSTSEQTDYQSDATPDIRNTNENETNLDRAFIENKTSGENSNPGDNSERVSAQSIVLQSSPNKKRRVETKQLTKKDAGTSPLRNPEPTHQVGETSSLAELSKHRPLGSLEYYGNCGSRIPCLIIYDDFELEYE